MTLILPNALHTWATRALTLAGARAIDAEQIARYLVDVDIRGIVTHGTRQIPRYVGEFVNGQINPEPTQKILQETDNSVRVHGDGGAGYLTATVAADLACEKALATGLALATTCHHGHVGSAGIYARRALTHGLISWGMAGGAAWRKPTSPDATVWDAMAAPPMCFGVPSDAGGPPLVLDMNANQFNRSDGAEAALAAGFHRSVFGSLGMRFVSTLLAGSLAGTSAEGTSSWERATRGFFFVVIDPALVGDADAFRTSVRDVIDQSLSLKPMAGLAEAALPGTKEWRREQERPTTGVPIPDEHRQQLEEVATSLKMDSPEWLKNQA